MADYASQALIRKSTDTELMPPPPPAKRIKRPPMVLDEDEYTTALSDIIARDFFPGLVEVRAQQEYLEALESKDEEWIASAGRKLTELKTPHRRRNMSRAPTPSANQLGGQPFDTPMSAISVSTRATNTTSGDSVSNAFAKDYDTSLSLDSFQNKYTSEDNASFNDLLDNQNQERRDNYGWMWRGNKISNALVLAEKKKKLLKEEEEERDPGKADENPLAVKDDRPAMPDTWKVQPRNPLMFNNGGVDDEYITLDSNPATTTQSKAAPKAISHSNTRLPEAREASVNGGSSGTVPPSPSPSSIRDAIAGNPRFTRSEAGSTLAPGSETPRVNGYSFVDDEPEATPSELGAPPLTWGTIDGLLPSASTTPSPFTINAPSRREATLHRMVDKVAKNKRAALKNVTPATPIDSRNTGTRSAANMTPAAQKLLASIKNNKRESTIFGDKKDEKKGAETGFRYRWTPTPKAGRERRLDPTPIMKRGTIVDTPIVSRRR